MHAQPGRGFAHPNKGYQKGFREQTQMRLTPSPFLLVSVGGEYFGDGPPKSVYCGKHIVANTFSLALFAITFYTYFGGTGRTENLFCYVGFCFTGSILLLFLD